MSNEPESTQRKILTRSAAACWHEIFIAPRPHTDAICTDIIARYLIGAVEEESRARDNEEKDLQEILRVKNSKIESLEVEVKDLMELRNEFRTKLTTRDNLISTLRRDNERGQCSLENLRRQYQELSDEALVEFARSAMQGLVASGNQGHPTDKSIAEWSWDMARTMLEIFEAQSEKKDS